MKNSLANFYPMAVREESSGSLIPQTINMKQAHMQAGPLDYTRGNYYTAQRYITIEITHWIPPSKSELQYETMFSADSCLHMSLVLQAASTPFDVGELNPTLRTITRSGSTFSVSPYGSRRLALSILSPVVPHSHQSRHKACV
jgi:hypothetical protein